MRRRRRGIALIDFMTGMLIFSSGLGAFVALTRSKFQAIDATGMRGRALEAVEERLDRLRLEGLPLSPRGEVDPQGYRLVEEFGAPYGLSQGVGRVEARGLLLEGGDASRAQGLYEVRVAVSWESIPGQAKSRTRVSVSTVSPLPEGPR